MSAIVDKVIRSGLIDKAVVEMLEKVGALPEGSTEKVKEDALKGAATDTLHKLADEMAVLIERDSKIRETDLELKNLKWPARVEIYKSLHDRQKGIPVAIINCMMDNAGRYYFKYKDAKKDWLTPGYLISVVDRPVEVEVLSKTLSTQAKYEEIVESQELFEGTKPVCYQVSVNSERFVYQ